MVTAHTFKVGLVSWPVGHSLSPVMHNAAFTELGLDWIYLPLPVEPSHLEEGVRGLVALNFTGFNVSVPHKTNMVKFLDEKSEAVTQMRAVNTVKIADSRLIGSNTDPEGFIRALREGGMEPEGKRVVIMGAGGAARAALYGLSTLQGTSVVVIDVVEQQALSIVRDMGATFPPHALSYRIASDESFVAIRENVDLLVNASPIGMNPHTDASAWPDSIDLPEKAVCFDMVYNPLNTKFLDRASRAGLKTISGLGMLVNQGAVSFETWTGEKAPRDLMYAVCLKTLNNE